MKIKEQRSDRLIRELQGTLPRDEMRTMRDCPAGPNGRSALGFPPGLSACQA